jgi:hypothetical protein
MVTRCRASLRLPPRNPRRHEFGRLLGARGRCLIVALFTGVLGLAGEGAELPRELAGGDESRAEQGPGAAVGLGVLTALRERSAGGVEHRVVGGVDHRARVARLDDLPRGGEAVASLVHELLRARVRFGSFTSSPLVEHVGHRPAICGRHAQARGGSMAIPVSHGSGRNANSEAKELWRSVPQPGAGRGEALRGMEGAPEVQSTAKSCPCFLAFFLWQLVPICG